MHNFNSGRTEVHDEESRSVCSDYLSNNNQWFKGWCKHFKRILFLIAVWPLITCTTFQNESLAYEDKQSKKQRVRKEKRLTTVF